MAQLTSSPPGARASLIVFITSLLVLGCKPTPPGDVQQPPSTPAPEAQAAVAREEPRPAPMPGPRDFGYLYWKNSLRHLDAEKRLPLVVKTGWYGLEMDVLTGKVIHFGPCDPGGAYGEPGAMELPESLPEGQLDVTVEVSGTAYRCVKAATVPKWPSFSAVPPFGNGLVSNVRQWSCRIREYGRYLQQFELDQMEFCATDGARLPARVMLQVNSWPNQLGMSLRMIPDVPLAKVKMGMALASGTDRRNTDTAAEALEAGKELRSDLRWDFEKTTEAEIKFAAKDAKVPTELVRAAGSGNIEARFSLKPWSAADRRLFDRIDEFSLTLKNPSDQPAIARVVLNGASEAGPFIMGALPVLADAQGRPVGAPFQNNHLWAPLKNTREHTPDIGPWLDTDPLDHANYVHNALMVRLGPGEEWSGKVRYSYAHWGGVPKASYYNLFLADWGWYTHWDCGLIGAWGESICPGVDSFVHADICDWRGLFVTSRNEKRNPPWEWAPNLGGANWFYLVPPMGQYPPNRLVAGDSGKMALANRWTMITPGPNLARTLHSGKTADGKVEYRIELMLPRTDDINRVLYRIRYDVLAPVEFRHLAFLQLGCAEYDFNSPKAAAWGAREGLQEEVTDMLTQQTAPIRSAVELQGTAPWWVSLHRSTQVDGLRSSPVEEKGNCSRGMVIRQWKAKLGGNDVARPNVTIQPTHFLANPQQPDPAKLVATSAMAEIVPPAALQELLPGDFVEMDVDMVLIPKYAENYLGPNLALKRGLPEIADTWKAVFREATGNAVAAAVSTGTLLSTHPVEVEVDGQGNAEVEIAGGLGYVPVSFSGVISPEGASLSEGDGVPVNQSVNGNDFWQVEKEDGRATFRVTYNIPMDPEGGKPRTRRLQFQSTREPQRTEPNEKAKAR